MKILPIDSISRKFSPKRSQNYSTQPSQENQLSNNIYNIGVPKSYISFRGVESSPVYEFTEDALSLIEDAKKIAIEYGHKDIMPQHILEASIRETETNLKKFADDIKEGAIDSISLLNTQVNECAGKSVLLKKSDFEYFKYNLEEFHNESKEALSKIPSKEEYKDSSRNLEISEDFKKALNTISEDPFMATDAVLFLSSINLLSNKQILYPGEFIKSFIELSYYRSPDEFNDIHLKQYDPKAIDVWNKLALGSNINLVYQHEEEADRLISSLIKTIDAPKHGSFNGNNTSICVFSDNITAEDFMTQKDGLCEAIPDEKKVFIINFKNTLAPVEGEESGKMVFVPEIINYVNNNNDNVQCIFLFSNQEYQANMAKPEVRKMFSNFVPYNIPPMRTFETQELFSQNRKYLKNITTPFTKQARNKAILHADKMEGVFPEKAVKLMQRIADYYGEDKKQISEKDVDEFAHVAKNIFNKLEDGTSVIYDTGKNLSMLYGKETVKKDLEAIVKQIKTGRAGTKGYMLYAQDEEAGSGKKFTAQALAGEAQVPYLEVSACDFAYVLSDEPSNRINPKELMTEIFNTAKNAAEQNKDKTAIIYLDDFEELLFEAAYNTGYKLASNQLEKEIEKAQSEDVNIIILGGTNKYYADAIPVFIREFNNTLSIDSPAFNKQSRKDILINRINQQKLPLAVKNSKEKDELINKLVKITAYMSFVEIKLLIDKAQNIMIERGKKKASLGDFIEAYLQVATGRTSRPEMPEYNKRATTSHECGHALNLEVMGEILKDKGQPWHQSRNVNFITLDPRGNFMGAVFEGRQENEDYPFEAMFTGLVCAFGGYSAEKLFFGMDGSSGISQDLAQATASAKYGVECFGFGHYTGKISNAARINSGEYNANVFKDVNVIIKNAQYASDLITETYKGFNEWFTDKYSKLIGTDDCMVDGDTFRALLVNWKQKQSPKVKEELEIVSDMVMDIIKASKNGNIYGKVKEVSEAKGDLKALSGMVMDIVKASKNVKI